jgi:hypothetical protein
MKFLEHLRPEFNEINPGGFAKIINKTHITLIVTSGFRSSSPNIRECRL